MTEPEELESSKPETVQVPRSELRFFGRGVVVLILLVVVAVGPMAWFALRQESTNDHLSATDQVVAEFLAAEFAEEDREQATACVDAHERYAQFESLAAGLTRAGATTAAEAYVVLAEASPEVLEQAEREIDRLLPQEIAPLLAEYPPPGCDLEEAARTLAAPPPELPVLPVDEGSGDD